MDKLRAHNAARSLTYLKTAESATAKMIDALAEIPARRLRPSPKRLPTLAGGSAPNGTKYARKGVYRTEAATLKENGAWKVVVADDKSTDWAARAVGPSLITITLARSQI